VSETKRGNAQVAEPKIETAIRLDRKEFEKAGLAMSKQKNEAGVTVSPMAGMY
jgi:cysteine desulfurase